MKTESQQDNKTPDKTKRFVPTRSQERLIPILLYGLMFFLALILSLILLSLVGIIPAG